MKESSYIISTIQKMLVSALKLTEYQVEENDIPVELNQQKNNFGDYASTIALQLAKKYHKKPADIAQEIVSKIEKNNLIEKIDILGAGFINFYLSPSSFYQILVEILDQKENYAKLETNNLKYNVEFISANPTGLLHLGHARNAAIGSSLANILEHRGYQVIREYYINDAGNQINILAISIFIRYQNLCGAQLELPEDSYRGPEIIAAAQTFKDKHGSEFYQKEFSSEINKVLAEFGIDYMLNEIKTDLSNFGVEMAVWFHESSVYQDGSIKKVLDILAKNNNSYQLEGATWLKSKQFGDDKDRVIVKSDGTYTYMLPDVAYHDNKYHRSDLLINIWGADHSGYINRIKAGLAALSDDPNKLIIVPTQMVRLVQNGVEHKMSKRAGTAITMKDLLQTVGKDVLRYFMISRASETHLDIDIDIAKSKNQDNPVFYLQYAHARINQIISQVPNFKMVQSIDLLTHKKEKELLILIDEYLLTLNRVVSTFQPHLLASYLQRLAKTFHSYYNECKIINIDNKELTNQRLTLVWAVKYLLSNGLNLIGVSAPNKM
ncbi:arginine--tRNA ligase [Spiroplasma platyhelix]|uniref:Arginine--tRNA ligase n=1 Tax=Spiroplasma platyhelix PALS-1 TaxID=1276218 RepID=A0A846TX45_9MOLU|nr:arginine--tRNA ligase [Spiroplasma platyhelix]MBE4704258.1 Arginine--tRNA ligase [Spiroplasma platyhelix PALS-1]NKE38631.1 arginine--tRNA ligase [Spiroplasma platyhelix PALS-1]UJB28842.1 arginyl-tRNA synthetase [Spiroplasma platyhelix PALS-1]